MSTVLRRRSFLFIYLFIYSFIHKFEFLYSLEFLSFLVPFPSFSGLHALSATVLRRPSVGEEWWVTPSSAISDFSQARRGRAVGGHYRGGVGGGVFKKAGVEVGGGLEETEGCEYKAKSLLPASSFPGIFRIIFSLFRC